MDWEANGSHQAIGHFTTSLAQLASGELKQAKLLHPKGKKKDVGTLIFDAVAVEALPSFCDFLVGGCELSLMVAIDFTASNGVRPRFSQHRGAAPAAPPAASRP